MELGKEFRFVKPRQNVMVRFPNTYSVLPKDGAVVPWIGPEGRYWRRRLSVGDVSLADPPMDKIQKNTKVSISGNSKKEDR